MRSVTQDFVRLLGEDAVVDWEAAESALKAQIAQAITPNPAIQCVIYPSTAEQLSEAVACAAQNRWRILPCGSGSKLHWGGLAEDIQVVISTARLNRLIEFASGDLTVTAEAGLQLAHLQTTLAQAGQFLPVNSAYPTQATLGGIVATADAGALRQRYGGLRDLLIGLTLVRSDGKLAKAGGRVVKNVAGYDLMKLLTGSYGTLAILSQLSFRIYPLPAAAATVALSGEVSHLAQVTAQILASALTPTALEILFPATMRALNLGEQMGLLVRFQTIEVSVMQQVAQVMQLAQHSELAVTQIADDANLWQQLNIQINPPASSAEITCKIGIEPATAVLSLSQIEQVTPVLGGTVQASSGLGKLRLPLVSAETLLKLRRICEAQGGFLSLLSAPVSLKQQLDVWGYAGDSLHLMRRLKTQFDPENLLSPARFVGKI